MIVVVHGLCIERKSDKAQARRHYHTYLMTQTLACLDLPGTKPEVTKQGDHDRNRCCDGCRSQQSGPRTSLGRRHSAGRQSAGRARGPMAANAHTDARAVDDSIATLEIANLHCRHRRMRLRLDSDLSVDPNVVGHT